MKKFWLLTIIMNVVLTSSYAQNIRLGVFADPLLSWLNTDVSKTEGDGSKLGINFGLMFDKFFAPHYAFTSGISIRNTGGTLNYKEGKSPFHSNADIPLLTPNTSVKYKLQYIQIPLALKLRTTEVGYTTFFADLGLDPMINIKAKADIKSLGKYNIGIGDEINSLYMAYHIGAGLEYKILGNTAFMTGITYTNGFTDITDNNGNTTEKTVLNCFELHIGIIF